MSLYFTAPAYSFIQPAALSQDCPADQQLCLPCSSQHSLNFQLTLYGLDIAGIITAPLFAVYAVIVPADYSCSQDSYTSGFDSLHGFITAQNYSIGSDTITACFNTGIAFQDHTGIALSQGDCFKMQIVVDVFGEDIVLSKRYIMGCTNCLKCVPADQCYSSVLSYTNSGDAFDFEYTDFGETPFSNVVELPMYLRDPLMENDQKVYTKSDGSIVKLYERKEEIYILETDLMPYAWHRALDIALSHDTVTITNPNASAFDPVNTATQFVKSENYQIEYQKAPLSSLGKATCKLINATPINLINNNCG